MSEHTPPHPRLIRNPIGFWEVKDKPSEAELRDYYAEAYYQAERGNYRKSYSTAEYQFFEQKIEQKAAKANTIRGIDSTGKFLDVGCGEGFALSWFKKAGWQVKGLEHSAAGAKHANPSIVEEIVEGNLFDALRDESEKDERYDQIWLINVLEHVSDPVSLMNQLKPLVTKRGVVAITVPNDGNAFHQLLERDGHLEEAFWVAIPDHLSYFDKTSLQAIATQTGWSTNAILGDFPIDLYIANPNSNYVTNRALGKDAHAARVMLENLIADYGIEKANDFFEALAGVGLGRNITAFLTLDN